MPDSTSPATKTQTLTIQQYKPVNVVNGDDTWSWEDIGTVEIASRARRTTGLTRFFQENADLTPIDEPGKYRILDGESARVLTVKAKPPTTPDLDITPE